MEIIYLLVPLAAVLAALIAWGLLWAIRTGQFDDLDRPGHEVLWDDPPRRDDAVVGSAAGTALPIAPSGEGPANTKTLAPLHHRL